MILKSKRMSFERVSSSYLCHIMMLVVAIATISCSSITFPEKSVSPVQRLGNVKSYTLNDLTDQHLEHELFRVRTHRDYPLKNILSSLEARKYQILDIFPSIPFHSKHINISASIEHQFVQNLTIPNPILHLYYLNDTQLIQLLTSNVSDNVTPGDIKGAPDVVINAEAGTNSSLTYPIELPSGNLTVLVFNPTNHSIVNIDISDSYYLLNGITFNRFGSHVIQLSSLQNMIINLNNALLDSSENQWISFVLRSSSTKASNLCSAFAPNSFNTWNQQYIAPLPTSGNQIIENYKCIDVDEFNDHYVLFNATSFARFHLYLDHCFTNQCDFNVTFHLVNTTADIEFKSLPIPFFHESQPPLSYIYRPSEYEETQDKFFTYQMNYHQSIFYGSVQCNDSCIMITTERGEQNYREIQREILQPQNFFMTSVNAIPRLQIAPTNLEKPLLIQLNSLSTTFPILSLDLPIIKKEEEIMFNVSLDLTMDHDSITLIDIKHILRSSDIISLPKNTFLKIAAQNDSFDHINVRLFPRYEITQYHLFPTKMDMKESFYFLNSEKRQQRTSYSTNDDGSMLITEMYEFDRFLSDHKGEPVMLFLYMNQCKKNNSPTFCKVRITLEGRKLEDDTIILVSVILTITFGCLGAVFVGTIASILSILLLIGFNRLDRKWVQENRKGEENDEYF